MDLHGGHHWIMGEHFRLFTTLDKVVLGEEITVLNSKNKYH